MPFINKSKYQRILLKSILLKSILLITYIVENRLLFSLYISFIILWKMIRD